MKASSKQEAHKIGSKTYFTGKPCPKGHIADRYVSNGGCSACLKERAPTRIRKTNREYINRSQNPERKYDVELKCKYGADYGTYSKLFETQNGKCAICGSSNPGAGRTRFLLDHDHITGMIRGLLCHQCNLGLGAFRDRIDLLNQAIHYLT